MSRETTVLVVNTHKIGRKSAENLTSEILTDELRGAIISPSISERANAPAILKMRGSRQVPWPNGDSGSPVQRGGGNNTQEQRSERRQPSRRDAACGVKAQGFVGTPQRG